MFRIYIRREDGTTHLSESVDDLASVTADERARFWVDLEDPDESLVESVGAQLGLDREAVQDTLAGDQRARVDAFDEYLFVLVYGARGPGGEVHYSPRKLSVFFSPRFVLTVSRKPLRTIRRLRTRYARQPAAVLAQGTDQLLFAILDGLGDNYLAVAEAFEDVLTGLEEESLAPNSGPHFAEKLMDLRREIGDFRRLIVSQRELLEPFSTGEYEDISERFERDFSHVRDHMLKALEQADSLREHLQSLRDNQNAAIAHELNAVMKTLTIFASLMLPLSLVAGIYGMNVRLWPGADSPYAFAAILAVMSISAGGLLVFFRSRHWL